MSVGKSWISQLTGPPQYEQRRGKSFGMFKLINKGWWRRSRQYLKNGFNKSLKNLKDVILFYLKTCPGFC